MSQRSVEIVIGRLATDEGFRRRFVADARAVLAGLERYGCELTAVEIDALAALDRDAIGRFAGVIDGRLQKADIGGS